MNILKSKELDISIIVPVYQEEASIPLFLSRIEKVLNSMDVNYEIIFSMDPSPDETENVILKNIYRNCSIKLITFSRRFGQPSATMAGIEMSTGKFVVIIDVDLQDPPELISDMYARALDGVDVVYAKRISRKGETLLKKLFSLFGSFLIHKLSDIKIPQNVGEYRMMSRRVVDILIQMKDKQAFIRGLVSFIGFKQEPVEFSRDARLVEVGKYNKYLGSISIGINGLVGFSTKPLQIMSLVGFFVSFLSFLVGALYILLKIFGITTPGLATIVLAISFFSGVQLLALGLLGEYIGRIYEEVRERPRYIVDKLINF